AELEDRALCADGVALHLVADGDDRDTDQVWASAALADRLPEHPLAARRVVHDRTMLPDGPAFPIAGQGQVGEDGVDDLALGVDRRPVDLPAGRGLVVQEDELTATGPAVLVAGHLAHGPGFRSAAARDDRGPGHLGG